jgi:hypothetical protein
MSRLVLKAWQASSRPQESGVCEPPSDLDLSVKGVEVFIDKASSVLVVVQLYEPEQGRGQMYLADLRTFQWNGWAVRQVEHAGSTEVLADRQGCMRVYVARP